MKLIGIDPLTSPLWLELVTAFDSDIFHSPDWLQVLSETYEFEVQAYVVVDDNDHPIAGIPFCHISDIRGERFASLPFSDYCDPLVADTESWNLLSGALLRCGIPYTMRCLHNTLPLGDANLRKTKQANWHGIDLRPETDAIWQTLHESARRAIRKAKREGVVVRKAQTMCDLRFFFEMHLATRKHKYHLLAQPYCFFERIWAHFIKQERGMLLMADYQGIPVGATLFLEWKDKLYYKFNTSAPQQLLIRPNDLILWEAIEYGKERGLATLDLGLSDWGQDGLVSFKEKYASQHKVISFLQANNDKSPAQAAGIGQLLPQLTNLFTDPSMPDALSAQAGDLLYRYFA